MAFRLNINTAVMTKTIGSDMAILALVMPFLVLVVISASNARWGFGRRRCWRASVTR
jgi:hypothetical protein